MLKRIAVVGATEEERSSIDQKVKKLGVQLVNTHEKGPLSGLTDSLIHNTASSGAIALSIQQADRSLDILLLLAEAIDCRESFRPKSSERLVEHATRFAKALGLSEVDLERAALLRDIGKLRIPNGVLLKDGLLTYDEWKLIQDHTIIGADTVSEMDGLADLADIIRAHHESFDGDGYPNKLEGEAIPFLARALKIIDVYCAMTSPRAYRTSVSSAADALAHLENERGKHFDPNLIDVFIEKKVGDGKNAD
jgi:HD-GYP domain-containing protein (c-di-GMP phosphodiesterase class II)